ncbi:hypothetical protein BV22DRAFT_1022259, partial [Leucogyrophana mollusca]
FRRSTRNSRIERLWVEVGSQFSRRWRAFFTRLERCHGLDVDKEEHIWLLQNLFLDAINEDCRDFRREWNLHPIAGPETGNRSPQDMRLVGQAMLGVYHDDCHGVHPDTINQYYGAHGKEIARRYNQTGAGHPDDEAEDDVHDGLAAQIEEDQQQHVRHDGVEVPENGNPFQSDNDEARFFSVLTRVVEEDITPEGYGLLPEERQEEDGSTVEILRLGRRGGKQIHISLAHPIWHQRAKLWCQALSVLTLFEADGHFTNADE